MLDLLISLMMVGLDGMILTMLHQIGMGHQPTLILLSMDLLRRENILFVIDVGN
jgi:hypothetical protein